MKDKLSMKKSYGFLSLNIKRNGKTIKEEGHNLILDSAEVMIAGLIAGNSAYEIVTVTFGDDNTPLTDKTIATLGGAIYPKVITDKTSSGNETTITFKLNEDEWNGNDIWQFALSCANGEVFCVKSRNPNYTTPIEKDVEVTIEGTWKIVTVI